MPAFRYVAIDPAGQMQRGTMEASDEAEVVARLQRGGSIPMRTSPAGGSLGQLLHVELGRRGLSRAQVTELTRELSIMLGAGQDLDRALRFLAETARNGRVRAVVEALRGTVRDGGSLAVALGQHPDSFPALYVGLVRAGEAGGTLAPTLERLAGDPAGFEARTQLWGAALAWGGEAAPFGLGTGAFTLAAGFGERRGLHPHNHALEALAEAGLPGLLLWLGAFGGGSFPQAATRAAARQSASGRTMLRVKACLAID